MEEFKLAHHKMVHGDKKYLIAILLEPLDVDALPRNLQMYLRTYTYIDATKQPRSFSMYNFLQANLDNFVLEYTK